MDSPNPLNKTELLRSSKVFCILPWVHLHLWPTGDAVPCCYTNEKVGSLRQSSMEEIWNSQSMRELRTRMLNGEETSFCRACYDVEKSGAGGSLRMYANEKFADKNWGRVEKTSKDGTASDFRLVYMDFRFSNLCNLRCRSCGPVLSSSWYKDFKLLSGTEDVPSGVVNLFSDVKSFEESVGPHVDTLEEIYFAGGEPLITEEHYLLLEWLVKRKLFHVRLKYSTNFTNLRFKNSDVLKLWPQFNEVTVWASLDGSGKKGEYIRKGMNWEQVVKNYEHLKKSCPTVKFAVQPTLGVLNAFHLPEFHRQLVEEMGVEAGAVHINPLFEPSYYRIQILPKVLKDRLRESYRAHIDSFLTPMGGGVAHSINEYEGALHYMDSEDRTSEIPEFLKVTRKLDEIRKESFADLFPELAELNV